MWFIGDVHGHREAYFRLIKEMGMDRSIQLGDLGIGFPNCKWPKGWDLNHRFFRGNHDNPNACRQHPNYLGDFGFDSDSGIYHVSGAWSIDHQHRTIGIDIWPDEELSFEQLDKARQEILESKPNIIATHDCPTSIRGEVFGFDRFWPTKTGQFFDIIFEKYQPDYWIFGHYHRQKQAKIGKTHFICLQELECCEIK